LKERVLLNCADLKQIYMSYLGYLLNSLGSVSVITDSTGAVKNTYAYDSWGNSLGKTEAVSNPWQFAGGFYDATTGLYKFGTRYYSPTLGRWTQQDPVGGSIGQVGSGNAYVYADNASVMMTDPSGNMPCWATWFFTILGVAGLIATAIFTVFTAGAAIGFMLSTASALAFAWDQVVTACNYS
jgi:RHS repeat-associated protein